MKTILIFLAICSTAFAQVGLRSVGFVAGTIQGSASTAWYPTNIADCTVWLKSTKGTYNNLGGTVPAGDNDPVWNWANYGSLGLSVTNKGDVTNAPTYHSSVTFGSATFPCLDFCNDQQVSKGKGLTIKTNFSPLHIFGFDKCTVFCVAQCRTNATGKNSYFFSINQETNNKVSAYQNIDSSQYHLWTWANSSDTNGYKGGVLNADTNWMLWEWSHDSSTGAYVFTNGVTFTSSAFSGLARSNIVSEFWVGNGLGIFPLEGQMAELVIYTNFLSGSDLTNARTYFRTNYNLW